MNERVADQNDGGDLRPGSSCLLVVPAPGVEGIGSDCFDNVLRNMNDLVVQMNPPIHRPVKDRNETPFGGGHDYCYEVHRAAEEIWVEKGCGDGF